MSDVEKSVQLANGDIFIPRPHGYERPDTISAADIEAMERVDAQKPPVTTERALAAAIQMRAGRQQTAAQILEEAAAAAEQGKGEKTKWESPE